MNIANRNKIWQANKRMERLEKAGIDNMILRETKNALLNFYLESGVIAPPSGRFSTRNLSKENEQEMMDIVDMFLSAKSSKKSYYLKHGEQKEKQQEQSYNTFISNYPNVVSNFQEWVDFIDNKDNLYKGFKEYYDSKTVVAIYDYGYSINLSTKEIQTLIKKQIRYGKKAPHDQRYDRTIARINKYYDNKVRNEE